MLSNKNRKSLKGHLSNLDEVEYYLDSTGFKFSDKLSSLILKNKGSFSLVIENNRFLFAAVDRIRSYPLFYKRDPEKVEVSHSAESLLSGMNEKKISPSSFLQFAMSGYVLSRNTLLQELYQLQPGEMLLWDKQQHQFNICSYYRYLPIPEKSLNKELLIDELSVVLDTVIDELIITSNGRPIYIPLSAGLDSRFLLAKLVEKKYDNVHAFSYGIKGNHEMQHARYIAGRLKVPWTSLPADCNQAYNLFNSTLKKDYEKFSANYSSIPSYTEFQSFFTLVDKKMIPHDAIIVNGQTGDFISGGHVRSQVLSKNNKRDHVYEYIFEKHFSLWRQLKTKENFLIIKSMLNEQLQHLDIEQYSPAACYEHWEWLERQSKYVVNGQRLYDFFDLSWSLPYWHGDVMAFWSKVPYSLKVNQRLWVDYLKKYNYKGLFSVLRPTVHPWVLRRRWVPYAGKIIGAFLGEKRKERFYNRKYYYSTYHFQYAMLGYDYFLKNYQGSRNPVSFYAKEYLDMISEMF